MQEVLVYIQTKIGTSGITNIFLTIITHSKHTGTQSAEIKSRVPRYESGDTGT